MAWSSGSSASGSARSARLTAIAESPDQYAAVAASTAVLGGGAAITVEQADVRQGVPERVARVEREEPKPASVASALPSTAPSAVAQSAPAPSSAERRAREAKRATPPAQQEFEPAWAAGEPEPTATASTSGSPPAPASRGPGGGAEEFAP